MLKSDLAQTDKHLNNNFASAENLRCFKYHEA